MTETLISVLFLLPLSNIFANAFDSDTRTQIESCWECIVCTPPTNSDDSVYAILGDIFWHKSVQMSDLLIKYSHFFMSHSQILCSSQYGTRRACDQMRIMRGGSESRKCVIRNNVTIFILFHFSLSLFLSIYCSLPSASIFSLNVFFALSLFCFAKRIYFSILVCVALVACVTVCANMCKDFSFLSPPPEWIPFWLQPKIRLGFRRVNIHAYIIDWKLC